MPNTTGMYFQYLINRVIKRARIILHLFGGNLQSRNNSGKGPINMETMNIGKWLLDGTAMINMLLSMLKKASRPSIAYVLQYVVPSTKAGYNKLLEFYGRTKYAKITVPKFFRQEKLIPLRDLRAVNLGIMVCKRSRREERQVREPHPYLMSVAICDKSIYESFYVPRDSYPEKPKVLDVGECVFVDEVFQVRAHVDTIDFDKHAIVRREPKLFADPLAGWFEEYAETPMPDECLKVDRTLLELIILASYDALPSSSWFKMVVDGWPMAVSRRFGFSLQEAKLFRLRRRLVARCVEQVMPHSVKGLWPYSVIETSGNEQFVVYIEGCDKSLPMALSHYPVTPIIFSSSREHIAYFSAVRTSRGELSTLLNRLSRIGVIGNYRFERVVKAQRFVVPWEMYNPVLKKWFWTSDPELLKKYHVVGIVAWLCSGLLEFWRELQQRNPLAQRVWRVIKETLRKKGVEESFISECTY